MTTTINAWLRANVPGKERVRYRFPLIRELHSGLSGLVEHMPPRSMFADIAQAWEFDADAIKAAYERLSR